MPFININVLSPTLAKLQIGHSVSGVFQLAGSAPSEAQELPLPFQQHPEKNVLSYLSWHSAVSYFKGRDSECQILRAWADSDADISILFVTGEGGTGKSRLGAEFARERREEGWAAGFLPRELTGAYFTAGPGSLFLVDYPEENTSGVEDLLRELSLGTPSGKVRVLFISRREVAFWQPVLRLTRTGEFVHKQHVVLDKIESAPAYEIYTSAFERVSDLEDTTDSLGVPRDALEAWLADDDAPERGRALFIVAAAIHDAMRPVDEVGAEDARSVTYSGPELLDKLVERERGKARADRQEPGPAPGSPDESPWTGRGLRRSRSAPLRSACEYCA